MFVVSVVVIIITLVTVVVVVVAVVVIIITVAGFVVVTLYRSHLKHSAQVIGSRHQDLKLICRLRI